MTADWTGYRAPDFVKAIRNLDEVTRRRWARGTMTDDQKLAAIGRQLWALGDKRAGPKSARRDGARGRAQRRRLRAVRSLTMPRAFTPYTATD
jgi:hypothetical protein